MLRAPQAGKPALFPEFMEINLVSKTGEEDWELLHYQEVQGFNGVPLQIVIQVYCREEWKRKWTSPCDFVIFWVQANTFTQNVLQVCAPDILGSLM